jgi:hypothetical protein
MDDSAQPLDIDSFIEACLKAMLQVNGKIRKLIEWIHMLHGFPSKGKNHECHINTKGLPGLICQILIMITVIMTMIAVVIQRCMHKNTTRQAMMEEEAKMLVTQRLTTVQTKEDRMKDHLDRKLSIGNKEKRRRSEKKAI